MMNFTPEGIAAIIGAIAGGIGSYALQNRESKQDFKLEWIDKTAQIVTQNTEAQFTLLRDEIRRLSAENISLEREIGELRQQMLGLANERDRLLNKCQQLGDERDRLREDLYRSQQEAISLRNRLAMHESEA
jgi:chromosome segregation ATPase